MRIKEISFKNNAQTWELEPTKFSDLTLLVGASGVGKTQILNAIKKLVEISRGDVYNGVEWDLSFNGNKNENYRWMGKFEAIKGERKQVFREKDINGGTGFKRVPKLLMEKLYLEDELVFERQESTVKYEKKDTPKISPYKSVLDLFTTESKIFSVMEAFERIVFLNYQVEKESKIHKDLIKIYEEQATQLLLTTKEQVFFQALEKRLGYILPGSLFDTLSQKESIILLYIMETKSLIYKLFLVDFYFKKIFDVIVEDFTEVFPMVEDIRFEYFKEEEIYELQIKERGTGWIPTGEISSGMFKTLLHLAEIKLFAPGFVVLIDEFENSLGVNCIDTVAADLANPERGLQYIITSHHPYIINNIDMKHWQVVVRKGTKVSTKTPEQLKLGKSKHEAFKQLLNTEEFSEGIS